MTDLGLTDLGLTLLGNLVAPKQLHLGVGPGNEGDISLYWVDHRQEKQYQTHVSRDRLG